MWRALLVILSAGLQIVIFPMHGPLPMWRSWLAWIALAPLLLAILKPDREGRAVSPLRAALLGYLCGVLWYAGDCSWIYQTMYLYGGMGKPFALLLLLLFALYLGLYHALFGWLLRLSAGRDGKRIGLALLASPFLWVAVELARARITSFPWDQLGMSQIDVQRIAAIATWSGVYGISFMLAYFNAVGCAWLVSPTFRKRIFGGRRKLLTIPTLVFTFLIAILYLWLGQTVSKYACQNSAVLLQPNSMQDDDRAWSGAGFAENLQRFAALSEHPPLDGDETSAPDVIIWPESPAPLFEQDARFQANTYDLAKVSGAPLILGNIGRGEIDGQSMIYNSASFFTSQGQPAGRYDKMHLVPFGEYVPFKTLLGFAGGLTQNVGAMTPGSERVMFSTGGHTYGVFICYESIFADEVRLLAKNGAGVLVNISDDGWYGDTAAPWQHLNMARMRAIENGRWLLRATNTGITAAIDTKGRIALAAPRHTLTAIRVFFAFDSDTTFYTRHGDWFAYAVTILGAAFLVIAWFPQRKSTAGSSTQG